MWHEYACGFWWMSIVFSCFLSVLSNCAGCLLSVCVYLWVSEWPWRDRFVLRVINVLWDFHFHLIVYIHSFILLEFGMCSNLNSNILISLKLNWAGWRFSFLLIHLFHQASSKSTSCLPFWPLLHCWPPCFISLHSLLLFFCHWPLTNSDFHAYSIILPEKLSGLCICDSNSDNW